MSVFPFPSREPVKCAAPRTEDECRPQRLSHVPRVLPSNIKLHSSSPKAFFSGTTANDLCESKGRDTSGLGVSKQLEISRVNPRLPVVGSRVGSEELEEFSRVGVGGGGLGAGAAQN